MNTTFVSISELSERTGLPESWLRRAADTGAIPVLTVGRRRMFEPEAVKQALAERAANAKRQEVSP